MADSDTQKTLFSLGGILTLFWGTSTINNFNIQGHFIQSFARTFVCCLDLFVTVQTAGKLASYVNALDDSNELRMFDNEIFEMARKESWAGDLCSQFRDYEDYERRALGVAILYQGELAAGASPYAVYDEGIEIEIDTKPEFRRKGLATVCGAKLILECLSWNLYPSWDAHDLRSVALAEKLGYHLSHPYNTYVLNE